MTVHLGIDDGALAYYLQAEGLTDEDAVLDIVPISGGRSNLTSALTVGGQRAVLRR
ncbi:MAG: hypothetical protein JWP74_2690, partial [Marmoricola sp.]|nr:hypothetical protein [Marmoricola sp.]